MVKSFKPCYKWITFNTESDARFLMKLKGARVLNLVINGLPSILVPNVGTYRLSELGF